MLMKGAVTHSVSPCILICFPVDGVGASFSSILEAYLLPSQPGTGLTRTRRLQLQLSLYGSVRDIRGCTLRLPGRWRARQTASPHLDICSMQCHRSKAVDGCSTQPPTTRLFTVWSKQWREILRRSLIGIFSLPVPSYSYCRELSSKLFHVKISQNPSPLFQIASTHKLWYQKLYTNYTSTKVCHLSRNYQRYTFFRICNHFLYHTKDQGTPNIWIFRLLNGATMT